MTTAQIRLLFCLSAAKLESHIGFYFFLLRLLGSEEDDKEDEINIDVIRQGLQQEVRHEEEKGEATSRQNEIDADSVLVKSVTRTYDQSSTHYKRFKDSTPFSVQKQTSMSVFANRSQT